MKLKKKVILSLTLIGILSTLCIAKSEAKVFDWIEISPTNTIEARILGASVGDTFFVNGIGYKITDTTNNTVEITQCDSSRTGALSFSSTVTYSGTKYTVTSIGEYAFEGNTNITSVTMPNTITSIGEYAFRYCSNLTKAVVSTGVTEIADGVFDSCTSLTTVNVPNGVKSLGVYAFSTCTSLTSIELPDTLVTIGNAAFMRM